MSNWSTDSNWYYAFCLLACVTLWLWRDLRDANRRKNELARIAQNLSERIQMLIKP